jgi:hypothetical protein
VKTAISVPDETFSLVERRAAELGISRSEFYTRGARLLLDRTEPDSLQRRIDLVVEYVGEADESRRDAVAAGRRVLAAGAAGSASDEW